MKIYQLTNDISKKVYKKRLVKGVKIFLKKEKTKNGNIGEAI